MRITDISLYRLNVPLITPFKTALRTVEEVSDIIIRIDTDTGDTGLGEAPPTKAITGETQETITAALSGSIKKALIGKDISELDQICADLDACMPHNTSAKAAADIALYDLYGKLMKKPVYQIFGAYRKTIETDLTISVNDPDTMAKDTAKALARGFHILKIKVGIDPSLDLDRLMAVRKAAGDSTKIRVDANQAWNAEQAVKMIQEMQDHNLQIELVEQPVPAKDFEGLKYVTAHSSIPAVADEAAFSVQDAEHIFAEHAADMVNIKLMKCGGLHNALKIADLADQYHAQCMLGCMLEAGVSVNAAVHLACARKCITAIDLDGPLLCSENPVIGGSAYHAPYITVSDEPGLGIREIQGLQKL